MKRYLAAFLGSLTAIWVSIGLCVVLGFFLLASFGALFAGGAEVKAEGRILKIDLAGQFADRAESPSVSQLLLDQTEGSQSFETLLAAIHAAASDKKIEGIYLDCQGASMGAALRQELIEALEDFKKSGKWIYAYGDSYTQGDYYVASLADEICLNPIGAVDVRGLASQIPFFKGVLDKLGIEMQVIKVGTYKSAVEPFILTEPSEASVLQTRVFLDSIWSNISGTIARARNVSPATVNAWADSIIATYPAEWLKDNKVVTSLKYRRQFEKSLRKLVNVDNDDALPVVSPKDYVTGNPKIKVNAVTGYLGDGGRHIALLYAVGDIVDSGQTGIVGDLMAPEIVDLADDDNVAGMVLRVNSGGGSAFASEQIWEAIEYFKSKKKPVYVSMADYAASGGYYISCGANRIYADDNTLTGSIGIFGMIPCIRGLLQDRIGINMATVTTNPNADFGDITRPLTPQQREALQRQIDEGYALFTNRVAKGRNLPIDSVLSIAEGRVWDGRTALRIGLVDRLGSMETAIADLAKKLKLKPRDIVSYPRKEMTPLEQLLSDSNISTAPAAGVLGTVSFEGMSPAEAKKTLRLLRTVTKMSPVQARMLPITVQL